MVCGCQPQSKYCSWMGPLMYSTAPYFDFFLPCSVKVIRWGVGPVCMRLYGCWDLGIVGTLEGSQRSVMRSIVTGGFYFMCPVDSQPQSLLK